MILAAAIAIGLLVAGGVIGVSADRQKLLEKALRVDAGQTLWNRWQSLGIHPEEIMIDIKHN